MYESEFFRRLDIKAVLIPVISYSFVLLAVHYDIDYQSSLVMQIIEIFSCFMRTINAIFPANQVELSVKSWA